MKHSTIVEFSDYEQLEVGTPDLLLAQNQDTFVCERRKPSTATLLYRIKKGSQVHRMSEARSKPTKFFHSQLNEKQGNIPPTQPSEPPGFSRCVIIHIVE